MRSKNSIDKMLGEVRTPHKPVPRKPFNPMTVVKLDDFAESITDGLLMSIVDAADSVEDDPLILPVGRIAEAVDEAVKQEAEVLVKELLANKVTHLYTG
jgi:hypothetical protein